MPRLQHKGLHSSHITGFLSQVDQCSKGREGRKRTTGTDCSKCYRVSAKLKHDQIQCSEGRRRKRSAETIHNSSKQKWIPQVLKVLKLQQFRSIITYQALEEYLSGGKEMGGRSKMSRSQCLTNTILTLDRSSREESFNQSSI